MRVDAGRQAGGTLQTGADAGQCRARARLAAGAAAGEQEERGRQRRGGQPAADARTSDARHGGGPIAQLTSQIASSRTSTGKVFSGRAPAVALTVPASGLKAPCGPSTIFPLPTS